MKRQNFTSLDLRVFYLEVKLSCFIYLDGCEKIINREDVEIDCRT